MTTGKSQKQQQGNLHLEITKYIHISALAAMLQSTDQSRGGGSPLIRETTSGGQLLVQQSPPSKISANTVTEVRVFGVELFAGCMD